MVLSYEYLILIVTKIPFCFEKMGSYISACMYVKSFSGAENLLIPELFISHYPQTSK